MANEEKRGDFTQEVEAVIRGAFANMPYALDAVRLLKTDARGTLKQESVAEALRILQRSVSEAAAHAQAMTERIMRFESDYATAGRFLLEMLAAGSHKESAKP